MGFELIKMCICLWPKWLCTFINVNHNLSVSIFYGVAWTVFRWAQIVFDVIQLSAQRRNALIYIFFSVFIRGKLIKRNCISFLMDHNRGTIHPGSAVAHGSWENDFRGNRLKWKGEKWACSCSRHPRALHLGPRTSYVSLINYNYFYSSEFCQIIAADLIFARDKRERERTTSSSTPFSSTHNKMLMHFNLNLMRTARIRSQFEIWTNFHVLFWEPKMENIQTDLCQPAPSMPVGTQYTLRAHPSATSASMPSPPSER